VVGECFKPTDDLIIRHEMAGFETSLRPMLVYALDGLKLVEEDHARNLAV
jgi:hypothetical protein